MNQERHPEVPVTYISSPELAKVMAYAENPHQNMSIAARENNLTDEVTRQLGLANEAGITAAKAYIDTLSGEVEAGTNVPVVVVEPVKPPAESAEALAPTLESFLTKEQLANVELTRTAMVAKFEHLRLKPEDLKLVMYEVKDSKGNVLHNEITLADLSDEGRKLGLSNNSWNSIMDKKSTDSFTVDVDGKVKDTRSAMKLPLQKAVARSNPNINEWSWTTGEPQRADAMFAPFAYLDGGDVFGRMGGRRGGVRYIAFRPAVVIAKV